MAAILVQVIGAVGVLPSLAAERQWQIIAATGGDYQLSAVEAPSINDNGVVVFRGTTVNHSGVPVHNIYASSGSGPLTQLMNDIFECPPTGDVPTQEIGTRVAINNLNQVLAWRYLKALVQIPPPPFGTFQEMPLTYLEVWSASGVNSQNEYGVPEYQAVMGDAGMSVAPHMVFFVNPATAGVYPSPFIPVGFSAVFRNAAFNSNGQVAFSSLYEGTQMRVSWPHSSPAYRGGAIGFDYIPSMDDSGNIIFSSGYTLRREAFDFSFLEVVAGSASGFSRIGLRPNISDDGGLIAFAAHHQVTGEGIYVAYLTPIGFSIPIKIAGVADGIIDPNESRVDPDGSGPQPWMEVPKLLAIAMDEPVAVNRCSTSNAFEYNLLFLATNVAGKQTLEHARFSRRANTPTKARTIVEAGETVDGLAGRINGIELSDPLPQRGYAAIKLTTDSGLAAVVRFNLRPVLHYFGIGVHWPDGMRGDVAAQYLNDTLRSNLESYARGNVVPVWAGQSGGTNLPLVQAAFDQFLEGVLPGDTLLVHIVSHGGTYPTGPEPAIRVRFTDRATGLDYYGDSTGDEYIALGDAPADRLLDHALASPQYLQDPRLAEVRKLIVLDACRSGGFIWDIQQAGVSNVAVLAACGEGEFSSWGGFGNVFTNAVAAALTRGPDGYLQADANKDGEVTVKEIQRLVLSLKEQQEDVRYYSHLGDAVIYRDLLGTTLFLADEWPTELYGIEHVFEGLLPVVVRSSDFTDGLNGQAPPVGDLDGDGDVDMADFDRLRACSSGPAILQADFECLVADLDDDGDVDQEDFGIFQRCYSGSHLPTDPNCAH